MKNCTIAQIANEFRQNIDDNPYVKTQEEKQFLLTVIDLYERYPKHYVKMLLSPKNQSKYSNILAWIEMSVKSILVDTENFKYTLNTKLNWIVHGRTAFPKCESEKCNNMIGKHVNCRISDNFSRFCSTKCSTNDFHVIEKARVTRTSKNLNGKWNSRESVEKAKKTFQQHCEEDAKFQKKALMKSQMTKTERYGNPNWNNRAKSISTYSLHCEKDPGFKDSKARKCKASKKERYGNENYVNPRKAMHTRMQKNGNVYRTEEQQRQINLTFQKNHKGLNSTFQLPGVHEKCIKAFNEKLGVDNPLKSPDVKKKIVDRWIAIYGTDHPWKNCKIQQKRQKTLIERYGKLNCRAKYLYNEITFDSSWELAIWIYCKDNGIEIEKATEHYEYFCNGKSHLYFPDFKICGVAVEVKGTQFFAEDGTMTCPYRNKDWTDEEYAEVCAVYKAKHQCMIDNNVKIMRFEDVIPMLNYIKCKYGLSYLKQFNTNKVKYNNDKQ